MLFTSLALLLTFLSKVALNEQFMVASLVPHKSSKAASESGKSPQSATFKQAHQKAPSVDRPPNRVLEILMRRLYSSQTFGANIIFMLNRAGASPISRPLYDKLT
jgi:hypothetical protein